MGGWTGIGKDTIEWDGTIKAKNFESQSQTSTASLNLDQTSPQTVINGTPIFQEGIKLGYSDAPRGILDINKLVANTIPSPANATLTFNYGNGDYPNDGTYFEFDIYAVRLVNGVEELFSPARASLAHGTDNGTGGDLMTMTMSFNSVVGADYYKIFITDPYMGYESVYSSYPVYFKTNDALWTPYISTGGGTIYIQYAVAGNEYNVTYEDPMVNTPSSISVGADIYVDSTSGYLTSVRGFDFAGNGNIDKDLTVRNNLNVTGEGNFGATTRIGNTETDYGGIQLGSQGGICMLKFYNSGGSTDAKNWNMFIQGDTMYWGMNNDGQFMGTNFAKIERSGNTAKSFSLMWGTVDSYETVFVDSYKVGIKMGATAPREVLDVNGTVRATGFKSNDGSAGITTTITTASLVGKTITIKNGLITGFA